MNIKEGEILNFEDVEIEDIELNSKAIDSINDKLLYSISSNNNEYKLYIDNNDLNVEVLDKYNKDISNNKELIINLIYKSLYKKVNKYNSEIIFVGFFIEGSQGYISNILYYSETTVFYFVFVTEEEIIIYSLNGLLQVIKETKYILSNIDGFGINKYEYSKGIRNEVVFKLMLKERKEYYKFKDYKFNQWGNLITLESILFNNSKCSNVEHYDKKYFLNKDRKIIRILGNASIAIGVILLSILLFI